MNLKPAKFVMKFIPSFAYSFICRMRGIVSAGMVMCAKVDGHVEILAPPAGSVPGDRIVFPGFPGLDHVMFNLILTNEGTPDAEMNPKKKIYETVQVMPFGEFFIISFVPGGSCDGCKQGGDVQRLAFYS